MATLKHIASKNSDYTAIEAYLVYQHDEFTGKQLLDEQGRPMLRESYILDTLECGDFSFATACLLANRKYNKNNKNNHPDDIKSHQYIISFDPRDAVENGLTMEKAQALGLNFCKDNFPGHPAIVCTHPDGHNHSGNIHVHIVIGSIRTREVERKPYMQKPRDWLEGMKHSSTAQTMRYLRVKVMELCEGAGLYQIDLLNGSKERVSEAEYWARRRGQMKLDRENAALTATGQQPRQKKFETVKDTLRKQISSVLYRSTSYEDFSDRLLQQYGIAVKESRGQLSYLPAGRTKFIRAKHLGDKFDKAAVLATLQANAERKPKAQFKQDTIGKLIDIQSRMTEGKGISYERWAKKHNLKAMAQTLILLQEKGLLNEDALDQRITELDTKFHDSLAVVKDLEGRMKANKELRYHVAAYTNTKNIAQQLKAAKRPAAFEEQHRAELTAYRTAAAYFKANDIHYFMGGIQVDERHRTSMRNLYAAGECCAQYHGANRLGGNSLLGAIYGGQIAAETACRETVSSPNMPCAEESLLPELSPDAQMQMNRILLNALGVVRDAQTLEAGIQEIRKLSGTLPLLGCAMLESALARKESRGAHWRADFPQRNDAVYCKTTVAHWNGQHIAISFESIPERRHDL